MIIRLFHAKVRSGRQAEFKKVLELLSLPTVQSRKGMIAGWAELKRIRPGNRVEGP